MYFDEIYHGRTGYEMLHRMTAYETTHPPLGKDFIMLGIAIFGMTAFGWRCAGTLFGVMLGRLAFGTDAIQLMQKAPAVRWDAVAIWVLGIAFYHLLPYVSTALGSALPTLALTFVVAVATRQLQPRSVAA